MDDATEFTYLGSVVTTTGDTEDEVIVIVREANAALKQLYSAWKPKDISTEKEMKIFSSNLKICITARV
jgi:hypothetical protein